MEKKSSSIVWQAPARPYKPRDREFWLNALMVTALVVLILFFAQEWFLITVIISFFFLYYILSTTEPPQKKYRLDRRGLTLEPGSKPIPWKLFSHFWVSQRWGHPILSLETKLANGQLVQIVVPPAKKVAIQKLLAAHLTEVPAPVNSADKVAAWLYRHLPLQH